MSERGASGVERLWNWICRSTQNRLKIKWFQFRVVLCRIRLFPTLISKIKWLGPWLSLSFIGIHAGGFCQGIFRLTSGEASFQIKILFTEIYIAQKVAPWNFKGSPWWSYTEDTSEKQPLVRNLPKRDASVKFNFSHFFTISLNRVNLKTLKYSTTFSRISWSTLPFTFSSQTTVTRMSRCGGLVLTRTTTGRRGWMNELRYGHSLYKSPSGEVTYVKRCRWIIHWTFL